MTAGSIAVPGAVVMINPNISDSIRNRLVIQLHIDEVITGQEFDLRFAANPDYVTHIRALRRRLMVLRDHQDHTNREFMDIVLYIKHALASVSVNCFGPVGQTYMVRDLYWGALCIFDTDINRTCRAYSCSCSCNCGYDGYCESPYYPALYDPMFPQENHPYNQIPNRSVYGCSCNPSPTYCLCSQYNCTSDGCVPVLDCRLVRA